jgi:hypothetical protein
MIWTNDPVVLFEIFKKIIKSEGHRCKLSFSIFVSENSFGKHKNVLLLRSLCQ